MRKALHYYTRLLKRWAWLIVLGVVICSGAGLIISKLTTPVYQASATLVVNMKSATSAYDNVNTSIQALQTYASLITNPAVLDPVLAQHPGLTLKALTQMLKVTPQSNSQLIEIDVQNTNPILATELANEISRSFQEFANSQLSGSIEVLPAQEPLVPIRPNTPEYTASGAAIGLSLALALIVIFEWMDDHFSSLDAVQKLLGMEILGVIPPLSKKRKARRAQNRELLTQKCRQIAANLNIAQRVFKPFKLVMVTSALVGEGKTTVAAEVAISLAEAGKRVLLVDANPYNPSLDHDLPRRQESDSSTPAAELMQGIEPNLNGQTPVSPNLQVVSASTFWPTLEGVPQPQWSSQLFEPFKTASFDYVLFDAPALLSAVDTKALASHVEVIVFVIDASKTAREAAVQAKGVLERLEASMLGIVINRSPWSEQWRAMNRYALASSNHAGKTSPTSSPLSGSLADAPTQSLVNPGAMSLSPDQREPMSKK